VKETGVPSALAYIPAQSADPPPWTLETVYKSAAQAVWVQSFVESQ